VLANEDQIITALAVDASSETNVVAQMLDQAARLTGAQPIEALFDTGYFHDEVTDATLQREVSLSCPAPPGEQCAGQSSNSGKFHKTQFDCNPNSDTFRCPVGQVLHRVERVAASRAIRQFNRYPGACCQTCPLRIRCTTAQSRSIKRYRQDLSRDALGQVMQQPGAQRALRQRKALAESVFARLHGKQKLDRFRPRGLAAATRKFALHVLACNLARAVNPALDALLFALCCLCERLKSVAWRFERHICPKSTAFRALAWFRASTSKGAV